jgi:hypothetical protein
MIEYLDMVYEQHTKGLPIIDVCAFPEISARPDLVVPFLLKCKDCMLSVIVLHCARLDSSIYLGASACAH